MIGQKYGAPGRIRTYDLRLRSPLLYPAELPGQNSSVNCFVDASEASFTIIVYIISVSKKQK
jgi:hypothetical protein